MNLGIRRRFGAAGWAVGVAVALGWTAAQGLSVDVVGVGFAPPVPVAPLEAGRLLSLEVSLHDPVRAGEILARVDPSLVLAERELASATMLATQEQLEIDDAAESRRFAESAEGSTLTRAQLQASIREDEALVRTLTEQLAVEEQLTASGATSGLLVDQARWQLDVADARLRANRAAMGVADRAAANAVQRDAQAPGANAWELVAAARAVEWIDRRLAFYDLTSGIDGHVTAIFASPGAMVTEGLPVLEVRARTTRDVIAFVDAADVSAVVPGRAATVVRATGERLAARLISVERTPLAMPLPLWPFPNAPRYGMPVRIELLDGEVAPDEPVTVRL